MMPYAINETGWRAVESGWPVDLGETYVDELPQWLVDKDARDELVRESMSVLKLLMERADSVIGPLQAGVDLDEISDIERLNWKAWKRYLIALSKTPEREGWPASPDWPTPP